MVTKNEAAQAVEKLLSYGREKGLLGRYDWIIARNSLLERLNLAEPCPNELSAHDNNGQDIESALRKGIQDVPDNPQDILNQLLDYAREQGLLRKNTVTRRDLFDTELMGFLMPRQSEVTEQFWRTAEKESIVTATEEFYQLAQNSNYIRRDRISRNRYWRAETDFGELEITINLAKPEKDPEEIAEAGRKHDNEYPRCPLCLENVGYAGRLDHPARQNLRVIPVELNKENWFLQYSPYVYYQEHCIVLARQHHPMQINKDTFQRLLEFLDSFPHYFIGSNADLPLVGGSILSHDHFQGGNHVFPMEMADIEERFQHPDFPGVQADLVKWPLSVIRLSSADREDIIELAEQIRLCWAKYCDLDRKIKAFTREKGNDEKHNTVTPIARLKNGRYELDLVLRNNRSSQEHPAGIFHPHQNLHHIKKENIGLIEVMGLAVLPGRLKQELGEIKNFLTGDRDLDQDLQAISAAEEVDLEQHREWLTDLLASYGRQNNSQEAERILEQEVGSKFSQVLSDAGVFKRDRQGRAGFKEFMLTAGLTEKD